MLVGKPEGKIPVMRSLHRWENNIKMYHEEIRVRVRTGLIDSG